MLNRTFEIIDYFQPKHWFVENPHTARTKDYIHDKPFFVVDYCMYGMPYRKRTNIWTNLKSFEPLLCDKNCSGWDGKKHAVKVNELGEHHLLIPDPECFEERHQRMLRPASLFRRLIRRRAAAV